MGKIGDIGQEIVILRASVGWTQKQLADKLETTQRTVAAWESGEAVPRKTMQVKIAQTFGLPGNYFFNLFNDKDETAEMISKIGNIMEESGDIITDEQKKMVISTIQEIMEVKK